MSQSSEVNNEEEIIQDKTIQVNDEITEEAIEKKKRSEKEQEDSVLRKKFELEMISVLSSGKHKASFEADESAYIRKYRPRHPQSQGPIERSDGNKRPRHPQSQGSIERSPYHAIFGQHACIGLEQLNIEDEHIEKINSVPDMCRVLGMH